MRRLPVDPRRPGSNPGWIAASEADRLIPGAETRGMVGPEVLPGAEERLAWVRGDWKPRPTAVPVLDSLERAKARPTDEVGAPTKGRLAALLTWAPMVCPLEARAVGAPAVEALRARAKPLDAAGTGVSMGLVWERLGS